MSKIKKKVVVGMSGGVDSSVVAALLKKQGYEVIGVFMQFWYPEGLGYGENRCCSLESWQEAREVARIIGIEIHKVNFGRQFKKEVVDDYLLKHKNGQTPNPCIHCNKQIKFGLFLNYAKTVFGADYIATGHYVKMKKSGSQFKLLRPKDKNKDQTYFLYNLKQEQLKHILFPLGDYKKDEVRALAKKLKLPVHAKADSQEICFVGNNREDFLRCYLKPKIGKILDAAGNELGQHQGLVLYTLGQRTGLGLGGGPWYVCGFDWRKNNLIVTKNSRDNRLLSKEIVCKDVNWLNKKEMKLPLKCQAQIRYRGRAQMCQVIKSSRDFKVVFDRPQYAAMSGQSVVFYHGQELLGGGVIV